jgi:acetyl esterase/lipase
MNDEYRYTFDAATLLEQCRNELEEVMMNHRCMGRRTCMTLLDLQTALSASEDLLLQHFQSLLEQEERSVCYAAPSSPSAIQELLLCGVHGNTRASNGQSSSSSFPSIVGLLRRVVEHRQRRHNDCNNNNESKMDNDDDNHDMYKDDVDPFHYAHSHSSSPCCYYPNINRNTSDALLFRLIVVLQLCLVRLDDARYVLTGRRRRRSRRNSSSCRSSSDVHQINEVTQYHLLYHLHNYHRTIGHTLVHAAAYMSTLFYGTGFLALTQRQQVQWRTIALLCDDGGSQHLHSYSPAATTVTAAKSMAWTAGGLGMAALTASWLRQTWNTWWMSSKIVDSTRAVELWNRNWHAALQAENMLKQRRRSSSCSASSFSSLSYQKPECINVPAGDEKDNMAAMMSTSVVKSSYALNSRSEVSQVSTSFMYILLVSLSYTIVFLSQTVWCNSKGEVRFLVLKRAMDLVYASMMMMDSSSTSPTSSTTTTQFFDPAAAADDDHGADDEEGCCCWRLQLAKAAFYASIGDRHRAMEVAASSRAAQQLLQHLWGNCNNDTMTSSLLPLFPPIQTLSLRAGQLLHQGAAVAGRVEICGITCFVLSREPVPEMASVIKQFHNRHGGRRNSRVRTLSSIHEEDDDEVEHQQSVAFPQRHCTRTPFEKRNVIFHLTGGGFFSHCIPSDLPNLMHWSAMTGAVVICPEYGLLPEHTFPTALGHVERVYKALLSPKVSKSLVGFEVNRLIVTGESAGGHLAVSLCTKLITDSKVDTRNFSPLDVLPHALLCSCPVLDLSLGSHRRAHGTITSTRGDAVVTAISDAYLPAASGIDKQDPRVSPLDSTNEVLSNFPPSMLLFVKKQRNADTENDPVVLFYRRLKKAGVQDCVLRAVAPHHLANNYIGLGMTGFPEVSHGQYNGISAWLCSQFGLLLSAVED